MVPLMPREGWRLLIVEDDTVLRRSLARGLKAHGHVDTTDSAENAHRFLLDARPYEAVLCDHDLPGRDGAWLLGRCQELHPRALRFLMSGRTVENLDTLTELGVVHRFLRKPLVLDDLVALLSRC